jgi:hypothetical protein
MVNADIPYEFDASDRRVRTPLEFAVDSVGTCSSPGVSWIYALISSTSEPAVL